MTSNQKSATRGPYEAKRIDRNHWVIQSERGAIAKTCIPIGATEEEIEANALLLASAGNAASSPVETTPRQPTREAIDYAIETLRRYKAMSDPDCTCAPGQEKPCDGCRVTTAIEGLRGSVEPTPEDAAGRPLCAHGNFAAECPHPHTDVK